MEPWTFLREDVYTNECNCQGVNLLLSKSGPSVELSELRLFCFWRELVRLELEEGMEFFLFLNPLEFGLAALLELLLESGVAALELSGETKTSSLSLLFCLSRSKVKTSSKSSASFKEDRLLLLLLSELLLLSVVVLFLL